MKYKAPKMRTKTNEDSARQHKRLVLFHFVLVFVVFGALYF